MELLHLYISPGHNFRGHHDGSPGTHPIHEMAEVECVTGRGLRGDRYFDYQPDFKGQITFFADEVYQALCRRIGVFDRAPSAFRRNVITRGVDLNALVGKEFEIQGVQLLGTEPCQPCRWMDLAFGPGTEAALRDQGGLRAKILTDGVLRVMENPGCPIAARH